MYKITRQGLQTEAIALHRTLRIRIVVGYDFGGDAYKAQVFVRSQSVDEREERVPLHRTYREEAEAIEAAYQAGQAFIDRGAPPVDLAIQEVNKRFTR